MKITNTSSQYLPVPMLNLHVGRVQNNPTLGMPSEYTYTELENYYVTPDEALSGEQTHKMSFQEAITKFIV